MIELTEIYQMQILRQKITPDEKFYQKDIKPRDLIAYEVQTDWRDDADSSSTSYDIVLTDIDEDINHEVIRNALGKPLFDDDHGYEQRMTTALSFNKFEKLGKNIFEDINSHIYHINESYRGLNSGAYYHNLWLITGNIKDDKYIVNCYQLAETDSLYNVLMQLSKYRNSEIKAAEKKERQAKADAKFDSLMKQISHLSKKRKQEIIENLIK